MKHKTAIIIVTADPRVSGRAAEAVRIAAGTGGWDKVQVTVCLAGASQHVLAESVDDLEGSEVLESYLPVIAEQRDRLLVLDGNATECGPRNELYTQLPEITTKVLAELCRKADMVLRF